MNTSLIDREIKFNEIYIFYLSVLHNGFWRSFRRTEGPDGGDRSIYRWVTVSKVVSHRYRRTASPGWPVEGKKRKDTTKKSSIISSKYILENMHIYNSHYTHRPDLVSSVLIPVRAAEFLSTLITLVSLNEIFIFYFFKLREIKPITPQQTTTDDFFDLQ